MVLLIEIGNTRIKWALADLHGIAARGQAPHAEQAWRLPLQGFLREHPAQACYLASVASSELTAAVTALLNAQGSCVVTPVHSARARLGVENGYDWPEALGVDRWLAMIAAYRQCQTAVCVVDSGTATTLDVVDEGGRHLGGLILPGLDLARLVLQDQTARIRLDAPLTPAPQPLLATRTDDAVVGGIVHATVALMEKMLAAGPPGLRLVLTGGAAGRLAPYFADAQSCPDLVMDGLRLIALECD